MDDILVSFLVKYNDKNKKELNEIYNELKNIDTLIDNLYVRRNLLINNKHRLWNEELIIKNLMKNK